MLWSFVPQLRGHVVRQILMTWLAIVLMLAIFLLQPWIVSYACDFLLGRGFVPSDYDKAVLAKFFSYGLGSLLLAWIMLELGGLLLVLRHKAKPDQYPSFQALLRSLAETAGVKQPTLIVQSGPGRILNAAATQSLLTGPKVVVMGNLVETLEDPEEMYVAAHELSHIKHLDIVAGVLIGAGSSAISIQKWAIAITMVYDLFAHGWRALVYLAATWGVLWGTHFLYKLLAAAHSRSREYLADVGAVQIAGWDGRQALVSGLYKIRHEATRWHPIRIFRRIGTVFSSHPDILDRLEALRLRLEFRGDGSIALRDA